MLRAGVEGLAEGAADARAGHDPTALAVTVLTSDGGAPAAHPAQAGRVLPSRPAAAASCARPRDVARGRGSSPRGSRSSCPASARRAPPHHDQARAATPGRRSTPGADLLVVGRAVTQASDPAAAAAALVASIA